MRVNRSLACALVIALAGATAGQAAELPSQVGQSKKPKQAEPAKTCNIAGSPGVLAANGICVRLSGYISTQFTGGQVK